jgi:phosphoserine phosphatase
VAKNSKEIAVFDVCDTLYFSNTTHDFVRFVVSVKKRFRAQHSIMNSKFLPFRYLFIGISVYLGTDPLRTFNVGLLKGYSRIELDQLARDFVATYLLDRRIEPVHAIVRNAKADGKRVILCSTSIDPVVAAVAGTLGDVEYISSTLEYVNDICTGRIADDVGTSKLERLRVIGIEGPIDAAYSDNFGDLQLLSAARHGVAVVHSERKKEFWRERNIETLRA